MLNIAICEGNSEDMEHLHRLIIQSGRGGKVALFCSAREFWASRPSGRFHVVFSEIFLPDANGLDMARQLRSLERPCGIVFTTTSREHALEAFRVRALQYLLKPVGEADVREVLQLCRWIFFGAGAKTLPVISDGQRMDVPLGEIMYVEVYDKVCHIHTTGGVVETHMTIEEIASLLPEPEFLRCHRAYVVNLRYVDAVDKGFGASVKVACPTGPRFDRLICGQKETRPARANGAVRRVSCEAPGAGAMLP